MSEELKPLTETQVAALNAMDGGTLALYHGKSPRYWEPNPEPPLSTTVLRTRVHEPDVPPAFMQEVAVPCQCVVNTHNDTKLFRSPAVVCAECQGTGKVWSPLKELDGILGAVLSSNTRHFDVADLRQEPITVESIQKWVKGPL